MRECFFLWKIILIYLRTTRLLDILRIDFIDEDFGLSTTKEPRKINDKLKYIYDNYRIVMKILRNYCHFPFKFLNVNFSHWKQKSENGMKFWEQSLLILNHKIIAGVISFVFSLHKAEMALHRSVEYLIKLKSSFDYCFADKNSFGAPDLKDIAQMKTKTLAWFDI